MVDLRTTYMGMALKNPIIAGASPLTANMRSIQKLEQAGIGAIVIKSLFEEEIQLEHFKFDENRKKYDERYAEMITLFPEKEYTGPKEHLLWVRKVKEVISIPVIASLNAMNKDTWIQYAELLQKTGVDGIELNFYSSPKDMQKMGTAVEVEQISILQMVRDKVSIPVSVKISPFYTNVLHFISQIDQIGVSGYVLFNRFFEPDIDIQKEKSIFPFNLSRSQDHRLPLRYAGILSENIIGDICCSTGIFEGEDVIKMILGGASCVQVVSTLFHNNINHLGKMLDDIKEWMNRKGYISIHDFKGKMNKRNSQDPWAYTRTQYVKLLMHPEEFMKNYPLP